MVPACTRTRVAFVVFVFCLFNGTAAYPQGSSLPSSATNHFAGKSPVAWPSRCAATLITAPSPSRPALAANSATSLEWAAGDSEATRGPDAACLTLFADTPTPAAPAHHPCGSASPAYPSCGASAASTDADLSALGKPGLKIARAREEILSILGTQNSCSSWFEQKDPNPASTFRTLSFAIDKHGPDSIVKFRLPEGSIVFRHPYAARVTQDGGAYSMITINAQGAFYRAQSYVQEPKQDGGPMAVRGVSELTVGLYRGSTLEVQMITLLHEFGHVISLLTQDGEDIDGTSLQNTNEVLRYCRAEIEARAKQSKLAIRP